MSDTFHYPSYRYEHLVDALAYARLSRAAPDGAEVPACLWKGRTFQLPTGPEQSLMSTLGIHHEGHSFRFSGYRYERLADAVNDARRERGRG